MATTTLKTARSNKNCMQCIKLPVAILSVYTEVYGRIDLEVEFGCNKSSLKLLYNGKLFTIHRLHLTKIGHNSTQILLLKCTCYKKTARHSKEVRNTAQYGLIHN